MLQFAKEVAEHSEDRIVNGNEVSEINFVLLYAITIHDFWISLQLQKSIKIDSCVCVWGGGGFVAKLQIRTISTVYMYMDAYKCSAFSR